MSYKLHPALATLSPYEVEATDCRIRLDANESFLDPGLRFRNAVRAAVESVPLNRYPDDNATALRKALAKRYGTDPAQIVAGNGSDELIALLIGSFLQPDETLLLPTPDFSMYRIFAETFHRTVAWLPKNSDLTFAPEEAIESIRRIGARAFLFSNPASPSAAVLPRAAVEAILAATDALVIVDEAYMEFSPENSMLPRVDHPDNLVVLRTCSKAMGCAGLRLGSAIASERIAAVLNSLRAPYNLNALTQAVGCAILEQEAYLEEAVALIQAARDRLLLELKRWDAHPVIDRIFPSETNYIYIRTPWAEQIHEGLAARSILVRNLGDALRITVGAPDENRALLDALEEILTKPAETERGE